MNERPLKLGDLAERIHQHLQRFEADPDINQFPERDRRHQRGLKPYFHASARYAGGSKMWVTYISYQGRSKLTKAEATAYLAWLDAGNVGRHYEALR